MRHDYCPYCELWNQYAEKCTYERCPADENPEAESPAKDAAYMKWLIEDNYDPEEEAAHKRYLRRADGGDHYPDDSYYD